MGSDAAKTGNVPVLASVLGLDILEVHPEWLDNRVSPPQYAQGQDLLEIGSDAAATFLYDCWTGATYQVPIDSVVLSYTISYNNSNSAISQRLRCRY
jgi:hypothetical protein